MSFEEIRARAAETPVVVDLPPLSEFYLPDLRIYDSIQEFERDLCDPSYQFDRDVVINSDEDSQTYPVLNGDIDPFRPALNSKVDWTSRNDMKHIADTLLCQSDINDWITSHTTVKECVVLVIVDGLSYELLRRHTQELPGNADLRPAFVDGVSVTSRGFNRIIYGNAIQSINGQLTMTGITTDHLGFTYWDKGQEELSTELHRSMHADSVSRIREFEQVETALRDHGIDTATYVQITRMGLDQESHNRKEEPDRDHHVREICDDVTSLYTVLEELTDEFVIYLTADHGIIWRDDLENRMKTVSADDSHPRHIEGDVVMPEGLVQRRAGETPMTALGDPYVTREFRHTEWGMHGGLSYYESIIPFVTMTPESSS